ncbi:hypothetical protein V7x_00680 [Crateriforma conspicua]|uniref:Uncharacterized protein n=1 Tax=Crateriforma conspicua TaxID=2527996 RepID=A0A5C6FQI3_9PLAN|nr:hypothetical protein [Crateriforma conspicua]TWU64524.1 hypothetical protein V7x_00680 [Crateriforma conspicua]
MFDANLCKVFSDGNLAVGLRAHLSTITTMKWSSLEIEIVEALTLKVRVFTAKQLTEFWPGSEESDVIDAMKPLCDVGFVDRREVFAHPIIDVFHDGSAAGQWTPGDPPPTDDEFRALADFFQSRWSDAEVPFTVFTATKRAANLMGSHIVDPPKDDQWTHDIHVAETYMQLRAANPDTAQQIIGEGALPKLGREIARMKDPDLFLVDDKGQAETVIEFAGAYDEKHLRDLHRHCSGDAYRRLKARYPNRKSRLYPDPQGTEYLLV